MSSLKQRIASRLMGGIAHAACTLFYPGAIILYTRLSGKGEYEFVDRWQSIGPGVRLLSGTCSSGHEAPLSSLKKTFATVVVESDSGVCVINPCALTEDLRQHLDRAGKVTEIVLPNFFHNVCVDEYAAAYPDATIHLPARLHREKVPHLGNVRYLADGDRLAGGRIEALELEGYSELAEFHFYHADSKTLIACDALHGPSSETALEKLLARYYYRSVGELRFPRYHRWYMDDAGAMFQYVNRLLARDIRQLVVPHGGPLIPVDRDALEAALFEMMRYPMLDRMIRGVFWTAVHGYRSLKARDGVAAAASPEVSSTKRLWDVLYFIEYTLRLNRNGRRRMVASWEDRLSRRLAAELGKAPRPRHYPTIVELSGGDVSPERVQRHIKLYKPFVIRGFEVEAVRNGAWDLQTFKEEFGHLTVEVKKNAVACMVHEGELEPMTIRQHIDSFADPERKNYAAHLGNIFHREPRLLDYVGIEKVEDTAGHRYHKLELFAGPGGTSTTMHMAGGCNFFMQMHGQKRWTLVDPQYSPLLSPMSAGHEYITEVDHSDPASTYTGGTSKEFASAIPYQEVILNPGDLLFMPAYWWHGVDNDSHSLGCAVRLPFAKVLYMPFCACDMQRSHWWAGPINFAFNRRGRSDAKEDVFKKAYLVKAQGSRARASAARSAQGAGGGSWRRTAASPAL